MISKFLSVVLLVGVINGGGVPNTLTTDNLPTGQQPVSSLAATSVQSTQPLRYEQSIPSSLLSSVSTSSFPFPQTIPEYLISIPRNVEFGSFPQSIPSHLLTITAPQASSQPLYFASAQRVPSVPIYRTVASSPSLSSFVSPAQVVRSKSVQSIGSPLTTQPLPQTIGDSGSQSSISSQGSIGFSTPVKPLSPPIAPNLSEVNKPFAQTQEQKPAVENVAQRPFGETQPAAAESPLTGLFGQT